MSRYTVICEYCATGEGLSRMLLYTNAIDEAAAKVNFGRVFDPYYAIGCDVAEGWNFDNQFADLLITDRVRKALEEENAYMEYSASLYMNFS